MAYRHVVRNPRLQARIFLPEWFMRVVKPTKELPENVVKFHIPMQMSRLDVKNYLQKIYQIDVANVDIKIQEGKTQKVMMKTGAVKTKKNPDTKMAFVTLAEGTFRFPELFPKSEKSPADTETDVKQKKPDEFQWS